MFMIMVIKLLMIIKRMLPVPETVEKPETRSWIARISRFAPIRVPYFPSDCSFAMALSCADVVQSKMLPNNSPVVHLAGHVDICSQKALLVKVFSCLNIRIFFIAVCNLCAGLTTCNISTSAFGTYCGPDRN